MLAAALFGIPRRSGCILESCEAPERHPSLERRKQAASPRMEAFAARCLGSAAVLTLPADTGQKKNIPACNFGTLMTCFTFKGLLETISCVQ